MKTLSITMGLMLLGGLLVPGTATAADLTDVDEIVKRTNHVAYYQGADGRARVKMTISDAQGRERNREFVILRRDDGEEDTGQKFYVYFERPADVRDMVFMVHKRLGADDDRWLYLPALDVIRRIAAADERTSFVGSHFFYEDVSGRGIDEDTHELVETTDNFYVLKSTPKDTSKVEFDSFKMFVHKASFIPVKVEFEKGGTVYRTVEALEVKEIQGFQTVVKSKMTDTNIGGSTLLEYDVVEYDIGLPEDLFTERYLRRAPREYLNF
jgi:hypothetical protein